MLTLYGFKGSRSIRVAWLLEELEVPYKLELFTKPDLSRGKFPKTVKEFSPTGEVPALKLEDGSVLVESGYIVDYILEKYGKGTELEARNNKEHLEIGRSLYTAEGNIMTDAIMLFIHRMAVNQAPYGVSFVLKQLFGYIDSLYAAPKLKGYLEALTEQVQENGNFLVGGHFSGADIVYVYSLEFVFDHAGLNWNDYPVLNNYVASLQDRPAYKAANEKHNQEPIHT